jgi:hypothetical protein
MWAAPVASAAGSYYQLDGLHAGPGPHDVGIWIGARGGPALSLELRGRVGQPDDGYHRREAARASLTIDAAARAVGHPLAVRRIYIIPGAFAPVAQIRPATPTSRS